MYSTVHMGLECSASHHYVHIKIKKKIGKVRNWSAITQDGIMYLLVIVKVTWCIL